MHIEKGVGSLFLFVIQFVLRNFLFALSSAGQILALAKLAHSGLERSRLVGRLNLGLVDPDFDVRLGDWATRAKSRFELRQNRNRDVKYTA